MGTITRIVPRFQPSKRISNYTLICRTKIQTNRGNFLLAKILQHRYPNLLSAVEERHLLTEYLSVEEATRKEIFTQHKVNDESVQILISGSIEDWDGVYPCELGEGITSHAVKQQLVLFLVSIR